MSWLLFYLLGGLYVVAFILVGLRDQPWHRCLLIWALMSIPAVWYCWDYSVIKSEHAKLCAAQGGLKVLIQPEKVDRVRFVGETSEGTARGTLETYYPRITLVEAVTEDRGGTGYRLDYHDVHTATPNPRIGQPMEKHPWKEPSYVIRKARVSSFDPTMYEISVQESKIPHGTKTETYLGKGGKVYAKHTKFVHWWTGIQYPDALPTWRCPDTNRKSPPRDDPKVTQDRWVYPPFATNQLLDLILN